MMISYLFLGGAIVCEVKLLLPATQNFGIADHHDDLLLCFYCLTFAMRHSDSDCLRHLERHRRVSDRDIQCVCLQTTVAMASHRWTCVDCRSLVNLFSTQSS